MMPSSADQKSFGKASIGALPKHLLTKLLESLSDEEACALHYEWEAWARSAQLPPSGNWSFWVVLAGRGFGKTRTGAEWVRGKVESEQAGRLAFVAKDPGEARDVMIEGESGILEISPPWFRPKYEPSKKRLTWPNGAIATIYSSEDPEELRGPQHDAAWVDELFKYRNQEDLWDQLGYGLRLGDNPQVCITSTPRPTKTMMLILKDPMTIVTGGSTYENLQNLSPIYKSIIRRHEGTRLGRQELNAEILDDIPGALWTYGMIDKLRLSAVPCELSRVVVSIDPAVTSNEDSAETGIIVAGKGVDGHGYVLTDATISETPEKWARRAIERLEFYSGDRIIAEVNNGGDLVESVLRSVDRSVPYRAVHASRGKRTRAEPISALYEQGLIHHVGSFPELEDQMCTYDPLNSKESPDRMDSLVWAFTDLFNRGAVDLSESEFGETMLTSAELKTETARDDEVSMLDSSRGWL
jgi:phage terminase large subunit-like protein